MSSWPRCELSNYEKRYLTKYPNPENNVRGVLRRMYPGVLELTNIQQQPSFQFQTARRSKVFGFTFAGDIDMFGLKLQTATGEQLFSDFMPISLLTGGYVSGQPGVTVGQYPASTPPNNIIRGASIDPFILDPAIELAPNQVLTVYGTRIVPQGFGGFANIDTLRVDMTIHVWEYPGMPGSPR